MLCKVSRQTIFALKKSLTKKWDTLLRIFRNRTICKFAGSLHAPVRAWLEPAIFSGSNRAERLRQNLQFLQVLTLSEKPEGGGYI
jgi:hypothetical protein